jgi:hypothetical protein
MKEMPFRTCKGSLACYEADVNDFLGRIMTGYE